MDELAPVVHRRTTAIDWAALSRAQSEHLAVRFTEHANLSATLLKGTRHAPFESFVAGELQVAAPISTRVHRQSGVTWLWQGPQEWLLLSDEIDSRTLAAQFAAKLSGLTATALDVSDRTLVLEISGHGARALLAKGTSLDLSQLEANGCCRTRFTGLHASLFKLSGSQDYGLIVDRALSVYLHSWLKAVLDFSG